MAAEHLGFREHGIVRVRLDVVPAPVEVAQARLNDGL
jgi:hypothetical protein